MEATGSNARWRSWWQWLSDDISWVHGIRGGDGEGQGSRVARVRVKVRVKGQGSRVKRVI